MKFRLSSTLIIMIPILMSACNLASGTTPVETVSPSTIPQPIQTSTVILTAEATSTTTPIATSIDSSTGDCTPPTDWPTYTVRPGDTLYSIQQVSRATYSVDELAAFNCLKDPNDLSVGQTLYVPNAIRNGLIIYWVNTTLESVPRREGSLVVACDTIVSPITSQVARVYDDPALNLRNSLQLLLGDDEENTSGWSNQGLSIDSIVEENGIATIRISGGFLFPGHCADGTLEAEMLFTIFEELDINWVQVFVDGRNLREVIDLSGNTDASYVYTREYLPPDWE